MLGCGREVMSRTQIGVLVFPATKPKLKLTLSLVHCRQLLPAGRLRFGDAEIGKFGRVRRGCNTQPLSSFARVPFLTLLHFRQQFACAYFSPQANVRCMVNEPAVFCLCVIRIMRIAAIAIRAR